MQPASARGCVVSRITYKCSWIIREQLVGVDS